MSMDRFALAVALPLLAAIDSSTAMRAFGELDAMCARDRASLWGRSLCGPTLFVDRATRSFVARGADGAITGGTLPSSAGIANTALDWNGDRWTMILWPLPDNAFARRSLLAHESFHRIAPSLGIAADEKPNAHLESVDGRWLMQLEWRALARALAGDRASIRDALVFRERRHSTFPAAASEEQRLETSEGLAEYTGVTLAASSIAERLPYLIAALHDAESKPSLTRSFAYATTPAWGTLLAQHNRHWTQRVKGGANVPLLLQRATKTQMPDDIALSVDAAAARYGGVELLAAERARDVSRRATLRAFTARFVDGPRLIVPLQQMRMEFNPNEATAFPPHGTVYPTITLRDVWGAIVVKRGGALIASDWSSLIVPARAGDDYTLTTNEGWTIEAATRAGDVTLKHTAPR